MSQSVKVRKDPETVKDDSVPKPKKGQTVVVHYRGTLEDGSEFDCSHKRNKPFKFKLGTGAVIKGWDDGIAQLHVGEKATLICPPECAYGARGHPGIIPPNATLNFEVELLGIE